MNYSKKTHSELVTLCREKDEMIKMLQKKDITVSGSVSKSVSDSISGSVDNSSNTVVVVKKKRPQIAKASEKAVTSSITIDKSFEIVKPVIKWVGGKTQIIDKVLSKFPKKIQNYYEPFLGGGSVLLAVLSSCKKGSIEITGNIHISDINPQLIALYRHIQDNVELFIEKLQELVDEFNSIDGEEVNRKPDTKEDALTSQESYYYWIRENFNELNKNNKSNKSSKSSKSGTADKSEKKEVTIDSSVMLLFMNKTCFRGVYREGPKGFNVPFGHYKNPGIIDGIHLRNVSRLLNEFKDKIIWNCSSFQDVLGGLKGDSEGGLKDFVYLDPPYAPETEKSFVGYTADGFDIKLHEKLFEQCNMLVKNIGVSMLMSNADVALVRDAFLEEDGFNIEVVECRRAINSKNPESKTNEVLIST